MNAVELAHLTRHDLSHLSRSLYAFFISPRLERGIMTLSMNEVLSYLENTSAIFPTSGDMRIALLALTELEHAGFIKRSDNKASYEGQELSFPFFSAPLEMIPERPFNMTTDWKPGPSFIQSCMICGLEDSNYSDQELRAFCVYWSSKAEERSQTAWERAFAQRLMKSRQAKARKNALKAQEQIGKTAIPKAQTIANPYQAER